ncbi:MAG: hotdog fold thioesterase [Parasphingorhabdus sp.]|uniref:PaaI family thioesterase n=1 Tax=Parasphingorhabdus sp. TaxID=2709688 RepID=UPI003298B4B6
MKHDPENLVDLLQIAPFHRWLGLKIVQQSNDHLELEMPWRDELVSNPVIGAVHGGILASLIDLTGLYTVIAAGGVAKATADLRVDYHRPATKGPLRAIGQVIKLGKTISTADTRILDDDDRLVASGRGTYLST